MKFYETPVLEMLELLQEQAIMSSSPTGESYSPQNPFSGQWS